MKTLTRTLLVLALILAASSFASAQDEGWKAPEFKMKTVDGDDVRLSDLTDKGPVLLDFWATWCQPCKQALPHLNRIYNDYKDQGFTMLAVSIDNTRSVSRVRPYIRGQGFEFPVGLDTDSEVLRKYRGTNVPHTVLIDQEGQVRKVWIGYHAGEEKEIEQEIVALLNKDNSAGEGEE